MANTVKYIALIQNTTCGLKWDDSSFDRVEMIKLRYSIEDVHSVQLRSVNSCQRRQKMM